MENKINIAELLKDCPNGMELDCLLLDNVTFERVTEDGIWIKHIDSKSCEWSLLLCNDGSFPIHNLGSLPTNCVIFPKGKTTWDGFQRPFKDGDIVFTTLGNIAIIRKPIEVELFSVYGIMVGNGFYKDETTTVVGKRHASEEEKQQLFNAINKRGYKWNDETKTLDKVIEPKFKVGDKVRYKNNHNVIFTITSLEEDYYVCGDGKAFWFSEKDDYELVPNKFDITTMKPFDKVLARCSSLEKWRIQLFEKYDKTCKYPFICMGYNKYKECIPYEGNEYLLDTADNCDEYYKTWK